MDRLFLLEDDPALRTELTRALETQGFLVAACTDFQNCLESFRASGAQLALLDVKLPWYDGYYWCREIRKESTIPIAMLSARDASPDKILGLSVGADDYITKPVDVEVLVAKLRALLRRSYEYADTAQDFIVHKDLRLDLNRLELSCGASTITLSKNEAGILRALLRAQGAVLGRDELIKALWKEEAFIDENTLNVNIARVRSRLRELGHGDALLTVKGRGYRLV